MDYRPFIAQVLRESSQIALEHFGNGVESTTKEGSETQVLTETDLAVGTYMLNAINQQFPDHNTINEETGGVNKKSAYTWVLDPIDGTANFAAAVPMYGIMLGLLENDIPIAGGIALPSFGETYIAAKGQGTICNGVPIHVTSQTVLRKSLVAFGLHSKTPEGYRQHGEIVAELIPKVLNVRSSASCYDIAMVAKGRYGSFMASRGKIWDVVAPQIIIEEAGGVYTHFDGSTIDYSNAFDRLDEMFSYSMGAPAIYEQVLAVVQKVLAKK